MERFHSVNGVDSPELVLTEREVTTYNKKGIPVRTDYEQFEFDNFWENYTGVKLYDDSGRVISTNYHGRISEYSYEETADGGWIEKDHRDIGEKFESSSMTVYNTDGKEVCYEYTDKDGSTGGFEYKYDNKGRRIEMISYTDGKVDSRIVTEYDDINENEYFCRDKCYYKKNDITRFHADRVIIEGGTKTITSYDYDADMNLVPFSKEVIVTCIDEDGKEQYLHEDLWMKGEHIWEYIYEYAGGDFNACTTIEKRFDQDYWTKEVIEVEYWD